MDLTTVPTTCPVCKIPLYPAREDPILPPIFIPLIITLDYDLILQHRNCPVHFMHVQDRNPDHQYRFICFDTAEFLITLRLTKKQTIIRSKTEPDRYLQIDRLVNFDFTPAALDLKLKMLWTF